MKIYLAGTGGNKVLESVIRKEHPFILESFYYADEQTEQIIPYCSDFLLDSGAFTFMQGSHKKKIDWDEYLEKYANFINRNKIEKFFELDIDSVVGLDEVLRIRRKLEKLTKKQCIPVWHTSRGKENFVKLVQEYNYVAIGGLVGFGKSEYDRKYWKFFPWFVNQAHQNNCKIHALGFTSTEGIRRYHFDSVDSTRWNCIRFGRVEFFDGKTIRPIDRRKYGMRIAKDKYDDALLFSFKEWIKFQKYAETHL